MILPKIVYNGVTLYFTYPPVNKPGAYKKAAVRHDILTTGGVKQSITEFVGTLYTLDMQFVPQDDLASWGSFMDWAVTGAAFDYYPDRTVAAYDTWTLEDTDWDPQRSFRAMSKFKLVMRRQQGIGGGLGVVTVTANTVLDSSMFTILCNNGLGSPITITLPAPAVNMTFTIKTVNQGKVTIATTGGAVIDGFSTYLLNNQYQYVQLVNDGTNWLIVGNN